MLCKDEDLEDEEREVIWTCCGGIELHEDERCPVCGEEY